MLVDNLMIRNSLLRKVTKRWRQGYRRLKNKGEIKNKLVFFIQSFLYTSKSLLLVPIGIIFSNLFEEADMHIVNLMIVSSIIIISYCFKNAFFYVYLHYLKSTLKTIILEQENELEKI